MLHCKAVINEAGAFDGGSYGRQVVENVRGMWLYR